MRPIVDAPRLAAALGPEVPSGEFPVAVHSVFRAAVNLVRPGGDLLSLLSNEACDGPQSIRLASVEDFASLSLVAGAAGAFRAGEITLDRPGGLPPFRVGCAAARRLAAETLPPIGRAEESWSAGVALLDGLQRRAGTDLRIGCLTADAAAPGPMGERLARSALALGRAVQVGGAAAARHAASRLVGLGTGLTPAGDDFLCGFHASALCRRGARPGDFGLLAALAGAVRERLGATTALSATLLRSALAGHFFGPLTALAEACAGKPRCSAPGAVLQLASVGHSSGMDAATGFFYGLTVWR
ncbi:MAG: DUF2877 domain-containing protein [Roseiarcus sp.]